MPAPVSILTAILTSILVFGGPNTAEAQEAGRPPPVLSGEVLRWDEPVERSLVTLHRVNPVESGPIDSVSTGADGAFDFDLPSMPGEGPDGGDVYFASVRHDGILYFGPAVNLVEQLDSLYLIEVYDSAGVAPGGAPLPVQARNLLLQSMDTAWIVVDLYLIRNDGERTLVSQDEGVVWSHPIPPGAENVVLGDSDISPNVDRVEGGELRIASPIPPGERTYMIRYSIPGLPAELPVAGTTQELRMLIEEPAPAVTVEGMAREEPVAIEEGSNYRQFAASAPIASTIRISEGEDGEGADVAWFAVILALVLAGGSILLLNRAPRPARVARDDESRRELLLLIAELDASFSEGADLGPEERKRYERERERLMERLRAQE